MNPTLKPWYKKKRYLIPLGAVAITALGATGDSSTTSTPIEQKAKPKVEVVQEVETPKPTVNTPPIRSAPARVVEPGPVVSPVTEVESRCNPNYSGCLKINAGDYDCASGSGNGPNYTGSVQVLGYDEFDLDRDGNGWGCENS